MLDPQRLITDRLKKIDASGIRRVFDLAAELDDPINLSIGQPDFDVPEEIKQAAADAITRGVNRYTQTQGLAELRSRITQHLADEFPQQYGADPKNETQTPRQLPGELPEGLESLVTSGVSGALLLAFLTCLQPGDEVIFADPAFVMYRHLVSLTGATPIVCDTYPDFQLTADRVAPLITARTKLLLVNSPANPTGVVSPPDVLRGLAELCEQKNVLLVSDEIYDQFCYPPGSSPGNHAEPFPASGGCPSPLLHTDPRNVLLLRGFSKTYAMTGWRLGYAVGPKAVIEQMTKLQQYTFVCAPSMVQVAGTLALDVDMSQHVAAYARKRDRVVEKLVPHFDLTLPGGAFYAFPKVPEHLGLTGTQFVEKAIEQNVLIIPGNVFSERDTHFRLSYACDDATLDRGLEVLVRLAE